MLSPPYKADLLYLPRPQLGKRGRGGKTPTWCSGTGGQLRRGCAAEGRILQQPGAHHGHTLHDTGRILWLRRFEPAGVSPLRPGCCTVHPLHLSNPPVQTPSQSARAIYTLDALCPLLMGLRRIALVVTPAECLST